jgi:site-specific DNA recombinase
MRKIAIYPRVSTEEQAKVEEGSIKNQIESLKKYIQGENLKFDNNWGELVGVYADEGYSAKSLQRPGVKKLLLDIYRGVVDTVIITEISRLSRSVEDWIHLRKFFDEHGASFIATRQNFDTSTAMGRAMLSFAIEFSQLERELTAERVKASYVARAGRGLFTGGQIPFGLEKGEKNGYLKVNPTKQIIAAEIFNIVINKARNTAMAVELVNGAGYYREDGKAWDHKSLPNWIRNPVLVGEIHMNRDGKDRNQERLAETERFRVVQAVWEPVIDKEIWLAANRILDERYGDLRVGNWKHHDFILTKILCCPEGKRLSGASGTGGDGTKYSHYRHPGNVACPCHVRTIPAGKIEGKVLDVLKDLLTQPKMLAELAERANSEYRATSPNFTAAINELAQKISKLQGKLDLVTDRILDSNSDEKSIWTHKIVRLQGELLENQKQRESLRARRESFRFMDLDPKQIGLAIENLMNGFDKLDGHTKHLMISNIIERVDIKRDSIGISIRPLTRFGQGQISLSPQGGERARTENVYQGIHLFYSREDWLRGPVREPHCGEAILFLNCSANSILFRF